MNPYLEWLSFFNCSSFQQLYSIVETIARQKMGITKMPFSLSAIENPPEAPEGPNDFVNWLNAQPCSNIYTFLASCGKFYVGDNDSDAQAKQLILYLKENPPAVKYENPEIPKRRCTMKEIHLMNHIFVHGIDLPGSKHNPFGHIQYYSSFFIDIFFGNYTEFMDHVNSLSSKDLEKELKRREGYCQYSLLFAPIVGLRMKIIDLNCKFTVEERIRIRSLFHGQNEDMHLEILEKLLELGADPNAYDIHGNTPLHHAMIQAQRRMTRVLLKHGANPNIDNRYGVKPLLLLVDPTTEKSLQLIDVLISNNAKLDEQHEIDELRSEVEVHGSRELAVRVREAMPRGENECEKCVKRAEKKCGACSHVFYCSLACQKLDWKFHKVSCKRMRLKSQV